MRRSVVSLCPGARRLQLRIAGILEVQRLRIAEVVRKAPPTAPALVKSRPRPRRPLAFAAAIGAFVGMMGCRASVPPAAPVESVGQLAAGPSVYSVPVHAITDLTPQFGAVEGDDSVTETVTTVSRAADAGADASADAAELPEVAPKDQGLKVGEGR